MTTSQQTPAAKRSTDAARRPRYAVTWFVSPWHDLHSTASQIAGLAALANEGWIDLRLAAEAAFPRTINLMRLRVRDLQTHARRMVAIEVLDRGDRFDEKILGAVDVYFKQTFVPASLGHLPDGLTSRIRPLGLTFGCHVPGSRRIFAAAAWLKFRQRLSHATSTARWSQVRRYLRDLEIVRSLLDESDWLAADATGRNASVVYQTRLWPNIEAGTIDRSGTNGERIELVQALRARFGQDDHIGLLRTEWAERFAPDLVLSRKVSRREYARQLRESSVSVNSHGLDGSPGFKLGEAMAAGSALVSQPLAFECPEPIRPSVHYLPFQTADECVAQCKRLLADPTLAERVRAANLTYYAANVAPAAQLRRRLSECFDDADSGTAAPSS